jgi:prephenate dehydrogenase
LGHIRSEINKILYIGLGDNYRGMFKKIAILGLGLLGGSICKGMKKLSPEIYISAYGRDVAKLQPALRGGYVDEVRGYDALSLSGIELAVVAMPIGASIEMIKQLLGHHELRDDSIVIDVGSVKEKIISSIQECRGAGRFIGCHPMAGSEKMGFEYSSASLFNEASVIITPHPNNRDMDITRIRELWEVLGAKCFIVSPHEHDSFVSYTSHLPHMIASSLVSLLNDFAHDHVASANLKAFIGRGFMDMTRISSGSPDMWRDIVLFNRRNILESLSLMIDRLEELQDAILNAESRTEYLHDYFIRAKNIRDLLG